MPWEILTESFGTALQEIGEKNDRERSDEDAVNHNLRTLGEMLYKLYKSAKRYPIPTVNENRIRKEDALPHSELATCWVTVANNRFRELGTWVKTANINFHAMPQKEGPYEKEVQDFLAGVVPFGVTVPSAIYNKTTEVATEMFVRLFNKKFLIAIKALEFAVAATITDDLSALQPVITTLVSYSTECGGLDQPIINMFPRAFSKSVIAIIDDMLKEVKDSPGYNEPLSNRMLKVTEVNSHQPYATAGEVVEAYAQQLRDFAEQAAPSSSGSRPVRRRRSRSRKKSTAR